MDQDTNPLEPTVDDMRTMLERVAERVVDHIVSLPDQPAADVSGGADLAREIAEPIPPESGTPLGELLELLFDRAIPVSYNTASPGYLGYIPGGGLLESAVADLIANAVNRYVGVWAAAPGLVQLEADVVRWFCRIVGYPEGAGGILTTGGSLAALTAVVAARRERLGDDFSRGTLYASDQVHHSIRKAAVLAGFPADNVRQLPSDEYFRLPLDALADRVARDRAEGWTPFFVIASAGTTNTGTVDDLSGVADLAEREGLWLHTDAAYGGFFMLTERGRAAMPGLGRADSITLDPHKGLFLPYGNGSLLVKDRDVLARAHAVTADYMPAMQDDPEFVDFCQISPELSRDFRGLRVWFPVKLYGIDAFRQNLDEKLDLTAWVHHRLREISGVEILAEPQLSVVVFRLGRPGLSDAELNELNRRFMGRINDRRNVYLTGTMLHARFALRICVLSFRTHLDRLEMGLADIRAAAAEALG